MLTKRSLSDRTRSATTISEVLVATVVISLVATMIATLSLNINFLWRDIRHHRLALNEMSNQLDRLTRLDVSQVRVLIDEIEVDPDVAAVLKEAKLEATIFEDALGERIELSMNWERRYPGKPLQMAGWLRRRPEKE